MMCLKFGVVMSLLSTGQTQTLAPKCDDLPWADPTTHMPAAAGTNLSAFSWHVHYLHNTTDQVANVTAFEQAFCKEFARHGKDGSGLASCGWGPNYLGDEVEYMCSHTGQCDSDYIYEPERDCNNGGAGECPSGEAHGPWSMCQGEFFVPASLIDEVTAWLQNETNHHGIITMRHPNTGCQWGDHFIRAKFFSETVPEMCLWGLPCNTVGWGCFDGMCGDLDDPSSHVHQHAAGCFEEAPDCEDCPSTASDQLVI